MLGAYICENGSCAITFATWPFDFNNNNNNNNNNDDDDDNNDDHDDDDKFEDGFFFRVQVTNLVKAFLALAVCLVGINCLN